MFSKKIKLTAILLLFLGIFLLANNALAISFSQPLQSFGQGIYGGSPQSPQAIAALIINTLLTFLGILFVILIIYAGFLYLTSAGAKEKIEKAKNLLLYAVIGLAIVLSAYSVTYFIFKIFIK